ncbi:MAG: PQQ-binding-like beta-propeller repeat protein [Pirellulales bacterium]|nr:PQQ-binding-like beta-propeller repeat protein [Pirellulales bacterium]
MAKNSFSALVLGVVGFWSIPLGDGSCFAQVAPLASDSQFELSDSVTIDEADSQVAAEFERAKAYLADRQWNEAVATLRRVMEQSGERLWPVTPRRFITARDYGNLLLAGLPPPALAVYRAQIDPIAERWYRQGVAARDAALLRKIAREAPASRWGDDALLALGEMALDRGNAAMARAWWERILPVEVPDGAAGAWLAFPDTDLEPAAVRARLVLASILEGSRRRAAEELVQFERLHPRARGWFGGREVDYAEALRDLLAQSANRPSQPRDGDWPTFAGAPSRTRVAPGRVDPGGVAWRFALDDSSGAAKPGPTVSLAPSMADVWSPAGPALHPARVGPLVLACDARRVWALKLSSGEPAWGNSAVVFDEGRKPVAGSVAGWAGTFGRPQYTMTARDGRLYVRLGEPWTGQPRYARARADESYLVSIDLASEGRLVWKVLPESGAWTFEGAPVCDGPNVYVAMRRGDIRPQAHVACYDARTGRPRWRRFICAAETPGQNLFPEISHNLLTLGEETLYFNTNLGAVAALSTDQGQVQWISLYPRRRRIDLGNLAAHWGRSLNPCLYHRGLVVAAPCDSRRIFGLDALTGQILWQTGSQVEDVVHLLGVAGEQLVACGRRVYWIGLNRENQGAIRHVWPQGDGLRLQGRGVLADGLVYIPADDRVYVLDQDSGELKDVIELAARGVEGGNLLVVDRRLLVATDRELVVLGPAATRPNPPARQAPQMTMVPLKNGKKQSRLLTEGMTWGFRPRL